MSPDLVNGLFELLGGLLIFLSIRDLRRTRQVKGVSVWPVAFFTLWGYWNLYYYPSLDQWASFIGGLAVVVANTIYVLMIIWYRPLWRVR